MLDSFWRIFHWSPGYIFKRMVNFSASHIVPGPICNSGSWYPVPVLFTLHMCMGMPYKVLMEQFALLQRTKQS